MPNLYQSQSTWKIIALQEDWPLLLLPNHLLLNTPRKTIALVTIYEMKKQIDKKYKCTVLIESNQFTLMLWPPVTVHYVEEAL